MQKIFDSDKEEIKTEESLYVKSQNCRREIRKLAKMQSFKAIIIFPNIMTIIVFPLLHRTCTTVDSIDSSSIENKWSYINTHSSIPVLNVLPSIKILMQYYIFGTYINTLLHILLYFISVVLLRF